VVLCCPVWDPSNYRIGLISPNTNQMWSDVERAMWYLDRPFYLHDVTFVLKCHSECVFGENLSTVVMRKCPRMRLLLMIG